MRFLIKIAFFVGLIALFLPGRQETGDGRDPGLSPVVLLYGVQQAFSDLGGFCDRSPAACATARDAASFVGSRVAEGAALGYAFLHDKVSGGPAASPPAAAPGTERPRAYTPPGAADTRTTGSLAPAAASAPLAYAPPERPAAASAQGGDPIGALIRRPPPQPYRQPGAAPSAPVTSNLPKGTDPKRDPTAAKEAYGAQKRPAAPQGNAAAHTPAHTPAHTTDRAAARSTALAAEPVNRADDAMPGVSKPFRMPAMAGGANGPRQPAPQAIVPPDHAPLPRVAPRA